MISFDSDRWKPISDLCWEGFDKVMKYASKNYPNKSTNKSLELFMDQYDSDWSSKIKDITKE